LVERIATSLDLYPCDLLFVHRDAEGEPLERRKSEIVEALKESAGQLPAVCVIPVRMQEAWLLFEESALRRAAGNPNGHQSLGLPRLHELEGHGDPKALLYDLLREASGLQGRRRQRFPVRVAARRVVDYLEDFSPLFSLKAFERLDEMVKETVRNQSWSEPL
jgi:hypothetical protein